MRWARATLAFAVSLSANAAGQSAPVPPVQAPANSAGDLQSPEQVSTRYSAYSLPAHRWSIDIGAGGVDHGDVYALLAVRHGLGAGVQLNVNFAHASVGLFNVSADWHFIDMRYFDLGAHLGAWYGHGAWFWFADPLARKAVSNLDLVKIPLELTASSTLTRWLELDLGVHYSYVKIFGSSASEGSLFTDSELGMQQFLLRPGARLFITDRVALELFAKLPLYSSVPIEGRNPTVPFKRTWGMEVGLRARLARTLFGNVRLNYAPLSELVYGARIYPSFEIEVRPLW